MRTSYYPPMPISSDPLLADIDLNPQAMGRVIGELAVHRESFSRIWSGSPEALECILDALITVGVENRPHAFECQVFNLPRQSSHDLSIQ
jgi:hypothetical protein